MTEREYKERTKLMIDLIRDKSMLQNIYRYTRWKYVSFNKPPDPEPIELKPPKYTAWESIKRFFRFPFWQD